MFPTVLPAIFSIHDVMAQVMMQVASLTKSSQVDELVVGFVTIQVSSGQHHCASSFRMWQIVLSSAIRKLG